MKIAVGASSFGAASPRPLEFMRNKGIEVIPNPFGRKLTEEETIEHLKEADGLLAGLEPLNERVLSLCPDLKAIARIGIGMDNVDRAAAEKHGIKVSNTPDAPTKAVSEMTVASLLCIARKLREQDADLHDKKWNKQIGFAVRGSVVLMVGFGRIGQETARLLEALGATILVYDPAMPDRSETSFEEAIAKADVISLHAGGKEEIFSADRIRLMKTGSVLLNSARGTLVNEQALFEALQSGRIAGCWLDVFPEEPYAGKLTECPTALLTPHVATYTAQCRESMEMEAVLNILRDLGRS